MSEPLDAFVVNTDTTHGLTIAGPWDNYEIDFDKVKSIEDVINILRGMRITVSAARSNPFPGFETLRPYLVRTDENRLDTTT